MTYEIRLPANYAFGTLTQAAAISDLTLTSTDFAARLPSGLSTTVYVPIVLQDPSTGNYEICWANSHTAASSTAGVLRGKESTSARTWPSGTLWTVAPTLRDGVLPVSTRSALPTDPHTGLRCYIQDEQVTVEWAPSAGWWSAVKTLAGRLVTTAGAINTGIGGTEVDIPKLAITGVKTKLNCWYQFAVALAGQPSAANASFTIRVRKDTALTGTVVADWSWLTDVAGFTDSKFFTLPWKALADNSSTNFYVSAQLAGGTGTLDINGVRRTGFWISDRGTDGTVFAEVA